MSTKASARTKGGKTANSFGGSAPIRSLQARKADHNRQTELLVEELKSKIAADDLAWFQGWMKVVSALGADPFGINIKVLNSQDVEELDLIHYAWSKRASKIAGWLIQTGVAKDREDANSAFDELAWWIDNFDDSQPEKDLAIKIYRRCFYPFTLSMARACLAPDYDATFESDRILKQMAGEFMAEQEHRALSHAAGQPSALSRGGKSIRI